MNFWKFANESPLTAFFLAWLMFHCIEECVGYAFKAYNRHLRSKNIAAQGWPTAPVDADGDVIRPIKPSEVADAVIEKLQDEDYLNRLVRR